MVRCLLLTFAFLLAATGVAHAGEPPNQNDPCSRAGRDSCGTTGKGSYRNYRYGVRWFGDYRGAVEGVSGGTFCIDLRFWYPSKSFDYKERSADGLKNKDGEAVSETSLRRMNRALWRYGRSDNATQQAAVMVYVHRLMGDGAPGEADPKALSAASQRVYSALVRDAERYSGPYRVKVWLPAKLVAGEASSVNVEVTTASGRSVPDVSVKLATTGADGAPATVRTGASGAAKAALTPRASEVSVEASAEMPAERPTLYAPTRGAAAVNGQRIVAPASETKSAQATAAVQAKPTVTTVISQQPTGPGSVELRDTVAVSGLGGLSATIQSSLYGPYATADAVKCAEAPVWTGTVQAQGDGQYVTAPVPITQAGYYTYREQIVESPQVAGVLTPCAEASQTTIVRAAPAITTQVSAQETAPGAQISDSVVVSGLGKLPATVNVELWGPFASRAAIRCEGTPAWTGTVAATGDGTYTTAPVTLTQAGYYTYRESIAESPIIPAVTTACGEATETTLARATPKVSTVASNDAVKPGDEISDRLTVSGLGKTPATVSLELFGPYATRDDIDCSGAPYWTGEVNVPGDGTFDSPKATVRRAGFYVFRERIPPTEVVAAEQGECAVEAETSLAAPLILGGRGDRFAQVLVAAASGPNRVRIARLGIDAPISAVGIDMKAGALGIPENIKRVGWWRDGAEPGAANGTVLLGGHVDSAKAGAGAFYSLKSARRGDVVQLDARRYRVTSVRRTRKGDLPASIYTRNGPARLVLVTCGGPFDAKAGHYRDNIIVTAVPA